MQEVLIICIIGGIAGWLAGTLVNLDTASILLDILIGILGGYIGYKLFGGKLNITGNHWINLILTSTAGAAVLCLGIKLVRKVV